MFFDTAFITVMTAQDVANTLQSFYDAGTSEYFKLAITDANGHNHQELWVRPRLDQSPFGIADGNQVVNCETDDNREISIIVPGAHREHKATVILTREAGSDL